MLIEENVMLERKVLTGHVDRVHRKIKKLMKEQMEIRKQVYKLDNKLDTIIWNLSQKPDDLNLLKKKESYDKRLSALMEQKKKNNVSLKKCDDKLTVYTKKIFELSCE